MLLYGAVVLRLVPQLRGETDVAALQRACLHGANVAVAGLAANRSTRSNVLGPTGVAQLLQAFGVGEVGDGQLPQCTGLAIGEPCRDYTIGADIDPGQASGWCAVLRDRGNAEGIAGLDRKSVV